VPEEQHRPNCGSIEDPTIAVALAGDHWLHGHALEVLATFFFVDSGPDLGKRLLDGRLVLDVELDAPTSVLCVIVSE